MEPLKPIILIIMISKINYHLTAKIISMILVVQQLIILILKMEDILVMKTLEV